MTPILALIAAVSAVHAPSSASSQSDGVVEGVIAGTPADLRVLGEALGESLSRQGLVLALTSRDRIAPEDVTRMTGRTEPVVARFRLDLTSPPLAKLYLTDGGRSRVHVRWLSLARGLDPVAIELVRFVIESSIEAMRAGRAIGVSREEYETSIGNPVGQVLATPTSAPNQSPPLPDSPHRLAVTAAYEGILIGGGQFQQGPAVAVSVRLPRLWVGAGVLSRWPITIGDDTVGARLTVHGLRVTASVPVVQSRQLAFSLGTGLGFDVSRIRPAAIQPDLAAAVPFWATTPILRIFGGIERSVGSLSVAAMIGLDLDLLGERYLVAETTADREAFVPWRFRPVAAIVVGARR